MDWKVEGEVRQQGDSMGLREDTDLTDVVSGAYAVILGIPDIVDIIAGLEGKGYEVEYAEVTEGCDTEEFRIPVR